MREILRRIERVGTLVTMGIDEGRGKDIHIEERWMKPTPDHPEGSWLRKVAGEVEVATGYYATLYPDKPSLYWHGKAPFVMLDMADWPWERKNGE